jgi:hypothetical protein
MVIPSATQPRIILLAMSAEFSATYISSKRRMARNAFFVYTGLRMFLIKYRLRNLIELSQLKPATAGTGRA